MPTAKRTEPKFPALLPATFAISMVPVPERGERWYAIVISEIRGDEVTKRRIRETIEGKGVAMDEVHRLVERMWFFGEAAELLGE